MKRILTISSVLAIVTGVIFVAGGIWGILFTYKNVAREYIVTPADSAIPSQPVRGPLTLKAQTDIIRVHTLRSTDGKLFSEMPRQIPELDEKGQPVLDAEGKPIMTANTSRDIWITATTLTTALNLALMSYAFSGLILFLGLVALWVGMVLCMLSRREKIADSNK